MAGQRPTVGTALTVATKEAARRSCRFEAAPGEGSMAHFSRVFDRFHPPVEEGSLKIFFSTTLADFHMY
jgi:hypothetical protein